MISNILLLILAFFSLIILMIIHEFGHFIIAKKFGVRVDEFGIGYPPRIFGKKIGETIYSVNWIPLGAFVRIFGEEGGIDDYRSFTGLKIWKRALIIVGGVAAFWLASILIFSVVFAIGTDLPIGDNDVAGLENPKVIVAEVVLDSPAKQAGLKTGDIILNIKTGQEEEKIEKISQFKEITSIHKGEEIILGIERQGQEINILLTPRSDFPEGQGPVGIGLQRIATLIQKYPWYLAPIKGAAYTWQTTVLALQGLYSIFAGLFTGQGAPQGAEFAGPLGITIFLANAASYGTGFFLYFIGSISIFIAIFNLFPIPALDGGKLIFLIIEKIKGKPVSVKIEQAITMFFFILLISLSIFITIKFDVPRFADYLKSSLQQ
jgi:regulator of sigma E protease